jgi:hypothetical protein
MIASTTQAEQYWHLHRSDCRNALIYAHFSDLDSLVWLTLPAPKAGDFMELILIYQNLIQKVLSSVLGLFCLDFSDTWLKLAALPKIQLWSWRTRGTPTHYESHPK